MEQHPTRLAQRASPFHLGVRGLCPQCGQGHLFSGFLRLRPACEVCGLDFGYADPADGPAFFVMSVIAIPAVIFAGWLELRFEPAFWVHLVTTLPFLVLGSLALLRPFKGWLVCSQFIHKAEEGRPVMRSSPVKA
jgi:uncharacterized protein (DUF983 family)